MKNILITGANRGIGYELTRQFLQDDARVFTACRGPGRADQLQALAKAHPDRVSIVQLDVTDEASIKAAVATVAAQSDSLDLLINNAGIGGGDAGRVMGKLALDEASRVISANAVSALVLTQACRPLLSRGESPLVVMISSRMGSIALADGHSYAYRMSKAAMNMAARVLALDSAMAGITTITTHPGWVSTDMGGPSAPVTPEQSAAGLRKVILGVGPEDNGKFFQYDGAELPW